MNSSGWLRSIITAEMEAEKYLVYVADVIGREFQTIVKVIEIMEGEYMVSQRDYKSFISKDQVEEVKMELDPYKLDRYILNDFMIEGFEIDKRRSGYIRYVFGVFE